MRSFRNTTGGAVEFSFHVDPAHYQSGCQGGCGHRTKTAAVSHGAILTFDDGEDNGSAILNAINSFQEI